MEIKIITAEISNEKLLSSTEPTNNNLVLADVDNCINNIRKPEKRNAKQHHNHRIKLQKDS